MTEDSVPTGTIVDWTPDQWTNFKNWLKDVLRKETVQVIFTKKDGTERILNCTLNSTYIQTNLELAAKKYQDEHPLEASIAVPKVIRRTSKNKDLIVVWDVDKNEWRSFSVQNLTNVLTLIMKYDYKEHKELW